MGTQIPTVDSSKTASTPKIALKTMIVSLLPAVGDVCCSVLLLGGVGDDASSAKLYKPFRGKCFYKVAFNIFRTQGQVKELDPLI